MSLSMSQHPAPDEGEKPFRLLDLPPEIVIRVLEFAVSIDHKPKLIYDPPGRRSICGFYDTSFELYKQPAITKACHWLRNEGLSIFYSHNRFLMTATNDEINSLWMWMASLQAKHLKEISVYVMLTDALGMAKPYHSDDLWSPSDFERDVAKHRSEQGWRGAPEGYVRMADGKVKITSETAVGIKQRRYYQLCFVDRSREQAEWRRLGDFPGYRDEEAWEDCFNVVWSASDSEEESEQEESCNIDQSSYVSGESGQEESGS
ncbi:hypothetical protein CKM354_000087700 [Cercospora kikuchii]|uniref:F-box domain-containing protein n=1 Tax=Cercospora kikuchii TaxID=84275 RepID=A0A9P3C9R4_9PEZI|nr:uncharacterized protein CKM354_000087700 [Cercospora kikuchii]GIZ37431.1 hypothetical protein CKM354_000087700 [Cercospora kikuchii]